VGRRFDPDRAHVRIYIDVGAHFGECIFKALNPALGFDLILAFEPSNLAVKRIESIRDHRIQINNFALGSKHEQKLLYGSGSIGASIFNEKKGNSALASEVISIRPANSELRKYLVEPNEIFLKLNCEGSEIEILQDLKNAGLLNLINHIYVDWDARKIPSLQEKYISFRKDLLAENINIISADDFPVTGWLGVEMWLGRYQNTKVNLFKKINYKTFSFLPIRLRLKELIKCYLPDFYLLLVKFQINRRS
jgi:FkbM family methyltransferase